MEQVHKINREATDAFASWDMFQIMGFNYAVFGEASVKSLDRACVKANTSNLLLFANFIKSNPPMFRVLQSKDWGAFAKCYNGPAYA